MTDESEVGIIWVTKIDYNKSGEAIRWHSGSKIVWEEE